MLKLNKEMQKNAAQGYSVSIFISEQIIVSLQSKGSVFMYLRIIFHPHELQLTVVRQEFTNQSTLQTYKIKIANQLPVGITLNHYMAEEQIIISECPGNNHSAAGTY